MAAEEGKPRRGPGLRLAWTVARVAGIPVEIHVSLLLILPVFAYYVAVALPALARLPLVSGDARAVDAAFGGLGGWLAGAAIATFLFVAVLLHEFGHAYVARRNGLPVKGITLWIFGGVSRIDPSRHPSPRVEATMAFAGPLVSFLLGGAALAVRGILPGDWLPFTVSYLGLLNVVIGAFNLLPAFPLDGGRLLRAALATRMRYVDATNAAAAIGKTLAVALGILGLLGNLWLLVIAFFVYVAAGEESKRVEVLEALDPIPVSVIMEPDPPTASADTRLDTLVERMLAERHVGFPVTDRAGAVEGIVTLSDVRQVPPEARATTPVGEVMTREVESVHAEDPASRALRRMAERGVGQLAVLDDSGRLAGLVTREGVLRAFEIAREAGPYTAWGGLRGP